MKVLILGASGMLASALIKEISSIGKNNVLKTSRLRAEVDNDTVYYLDAENPSFDAFQGIHFDFVINAIGIIKPYISPQNADSIRKAILVNSLFPIELSKWAADRGSKIIQIATDCVFSGKTGNYLESSEQDATDIYGKTKSLGEVSSPNFMHLRASIIGREKKNYSSLISWVCNQKTNSTITGYIDHFWNGVTTNAFAKVCKGIIRSNTFDAGTFHLVPDDAVTKDELVRLIAKRFQRDDLNIIPGRSPKAAIMTLSTNYIDKNQMLWNDAGYSKIPTIRQMVNDL